MAGVIDLYMAELGRRLAFDTALRARVCAEVEDHLREAAEHGAADPLTAERRAVARFGAARDIAARFACDALAGETRRTWLTFAAAAGGALIAMRLRRMLIDTAAFDAAPFAALLDRYAFIAALAAGAAGWLIWRFAPRSGGAGVDRFRLPARIAAFALAALALSIAGGAVIAARHLSTPTLTAFLLEIAMALWLGLQILALRRRTRAAAKALAP